MDQLLRQHADAIISRAIAAVQPDDAVRRALEGKTFPGRVIVVAAGKAAWQMAKAAHDQLGERIDEGVVITKYGHDMGPIGNFLCFEAAHPIPDVRTFEATEFALDMVYDLNPEDTVLFLLSGGGSALFEKPLCRSIVLLYVTDQLLKSGADIVQINTIRKRLSAVKGGRFAKLCEPAQVFTVVLSDILGDPLDMIASGPAYPDSSTCEQALDIAKQYNLEIWDEIEPLLRQETPKELHNVTTCVTGSVKELCRAAADACRELGYEPIILTDQLACQARDAGSFLASIIKTHAGSGKKIAFIAGGETVVKVTGTGLGGRNQEIALSAALGIAGIPGAAVFSVGSDGTDGPTDAAGGYVDHTTAAQLKSKGISISDMLANNDAYHALQACDGLIITGPTGTNVNDVAVALLNP